MQIPKVKLNQEHSNFCFMLVVALVAHSEKPLRSFSTVLFFNKLWKSQ